MTGRDGERFELIRELGQGGMGRVILVRDGERRQQVAMKRILHANATARLRFKREFRALAQQIHPNLVRLYELGDADGLYFTMAYVPGCDVLTYCRDHSGAIPDSGSGSRSGSGSSAPSGDGLTLQGTPPPEALAPTLADTGDPIPGPSATPSAPRVQVGAATLPATLRRLAHILPQMVEALCFLHDQGIVHRDLKPSNVLVTPAGTVKLLDFGIIAERGVPAAAPDGKEILGTPAYMAPEQGQGEAQPESDLYALGCMLFEIVAGRTVFPGEGALRQLLRHQTEEPPRLSDVVPEAPVALVDAVAQLLAKDPEARPSLQRLADTLLPALGARPANLGAPTLAMPDLLGRQAEQAILRERCTDLRRRVFHAVTLAGPSGVGKTALAEWLARVAATDGATVLRGRGRSAERVAFNAVDAAIDDLAMVLGQRRRSRTDPADLRARASTLFPVLTPRRGTVAPDSGSRLEGFAAVAALLQSVARHGAGVVILVDDLQWADEDSIALLQHLQDTAPRGVLCVATLRTDTGEHPAQRLLDSERAEVLQVGPLGLETMEDLVARSAGADARIPAKALHHLAEACSGRPALAELAGRSLARGADEAGDPLLALAAQIDDLDEETRRVLASLVAADDWTRASDLARLTGSNPGALQDRLQELALGGLVRRAGPEGPDGRVDLYHDTVRSALLQRLDAALVRQSHRAHADHLQTRPEGTPERLVRHLLAAGDEAEAATHAREAAARAEAQQAYGLAADMYGVALRHPSQDRLRLLRARATCLERGARYQEAAQTWRELRADSTGEDALDAGIREATALLAADDVSGGHKRLQSALRAAGEPVEGGLGDLWAGLAFLRGPPRRERFTPQAPEEIPPEARARAERDVRIGMMMGYFDPLSGIRFVRRARKRLVAMGDVEQVAWCDGIFAYFAHNGANNAGRVPLADRYLASLRRHLAHIAEPDPLMAIYPLFLDGVDAQRRDDFRQARALLESAQALLEEAGRAGTFEHLYIQSHLVMQAGAENDLPGFDASLARFRRLSRETGDSALRTHVVFGEINALCIHGRFEEAEAAAVAVQQTFPSDRPTIQRLLADLYRHLPSIYQTDGHRARQELRDALLRGRRFRPHSLMITGLLYGICALNEVNALRTGDPKASGRQVRRYVRRALAGLPGMTAWSRRALAYAADARGRPEEAVTLLQRAEQDAERLGQPIYVAMARFQRGLRVGGDEGAALQAEARALLLPTGASTRLLWEDAATRPAVEEQI